MLLFLLVCFQLQPNRHTAIWELRKVLRQINMCRGRDLWLRCWIAQVHIARGRFPPFTTAVLFSTQLFHGIDIHIVTLPIKVCSRWKSGRFNPRTGDGVSWRSPHPNPREEVDTRLQLNVICASLHCYSSHSNNQQQQWNIATAPGRFRSNVSCLLNRKGWEQKSKTRREAKLCQKVSIWLP